MAALFLLALGLIAWQALRTKPVQPPAFEFATKAGERVFPLAVPFWRTPGELPQDPSERLAYLIDRSLTWAAAEEEKGAQACQVFVRVSALHWARREAPPARVARWLGVEEKSPPSWRQAYLPAASSLDDRDGDGDPLDDGELRAAGRGAEVEIFCEEAR